MNFTAVKNCNILPRRVIVITYFVCYRLENNCLNVFDEFFDYETFLQIPTMGERYSANGQCQNVFGRTSSKCVSSWKLKM